jgi:hypothetical protein
MPDQANDQEMFNRSVYRVLNHLATAIRQVADGVPPTPQIDEAKENLEWAGTELQNMRVFPGSNPD